MAGAFVSLVLDGLQDSEVHPTAKLVAAVLGDCANIKSGGVAFPSVATLARKASISEGMVRVHLQALETRGWISKESAGNGGQGLATRYRLNLDRMRPLAAAKATVHRRVKGNGRPFGKPAASSEQPAGPPVPNPTVDQPQANGGATTTHRSTGAELELEPLLTGFEPEARAGANSLPQAIGQIPIFRKMKIGPESTVPNTTAIGRGSKPRFGNGMHAETEAERIERIERKREESLAYVAANRTPTQ